jgi:DNA repair protein RadC
MPKIPIYETRLVDTRKRVMLARDSASCAEHAVEIAKALLSGSTCERILAIFVNGSNEVIGVQQVSQGGLRGSAIIPRDVLQGAMLANASAIILVHNHPSGDSSPSADDVITTRTLATICDAVGIYLLDHIVWTPKGWSCVEWRP